MKVVLAAALLLFAGCATMQPVELTDAELKANLQTALQAESDLDLRYVTLDVHERVVTVSGLVNSFSDKQRLDRIVRGTPGVDQIVLNVVIQE